MPRYGIERLAKRKAERLANRTKEEIEKEARAAEQALDYDIDRISKVREMDDSLSQDQRDSAKFRREKRQEWREKARRKERKK